MNWEREREKRERGTSALLEKVWREDDREILRSHFIEIALLADFVGEVEKLQHKAPVVNRESLDNPR